MTKKQYAKFAIVSFLFSTAFMFIIWPGDGVKNIGAALFGTVVTVGLFKTAEWIMKP